MHYYIFETNLGWAAIAGTDGLISDLVLPVGTRDEAAEAIRARIGADAVESSADFSGQADVLAAYFSGEPVEFACELDFGTATDFDRMVWEAAREVPYGKIATYGYLADRIGRPRAARAVGNALGRNRVPVIVPCHRILRANAELGGFGAGIDWKIGLLQLERAGARKGRRDV